MTSNDAALHVYRREISSNEQTSLTVIAEQVAPRSAVLDLGTGSGALGRHLRDIQGCVVDGVTLNEAEAALARPHYRRIEVADLDDAPIAELFRGSRYDRIVCADVLEHLKQPERVLRACRDLLTPTGRLLISVPNVGYCGLIAELMQGEFEYRPEGLLDRTHLRFFTRRSLARFLESEGWSIATWQTVTRVLSGSEFRVPFDLLPPSVSRHLLAIPDAMTYQFVVDATPQPVPAQLPLPMAPAEPVGQALFSAELFLGHAGDYTQEGKLVARGVIGQMRQVLSFRWGDEVRPWSSIRLDPADRPGFLHLYRLTLKDADGATCWQWRHEVDNSALLAAAPAQQLLLRPPWPEGSPLPALLFGDDPWIELPIDAAAMRGFGERRAGSLEVEMGWPMSADYLAFTEPFQARLGQLEIQRRQAEVQLQGLARELSVLQDSERALLEQRDHLLAQKNRVVEEKRELQQAHLQLRGEFDGLAAHVQRIETSTLFRATRPLSDLKGWIDRTLRGRTAAATAVMEPVSHPIAPLATPIDVVVPVYRGLDDTRRCLESVLAAVNRCDFRVVVINDASPESELADWLRALSRRDPRIVLLENAENLGFVGTVNRGMSHGPDRDVVLLNSDTVVANDWLDRLRRAAYSDARVATVTPFSNNATIFSYPRTCEPNSLPAGHDTASLDALFARTLAGRTLDVPTGVGFCMYIRRDCLAEVGLFDVEQFGKGYGEENDFCQRAQKAGWRNLHALDTFVLHAGGVSFGASKSARELAAMETLRRLHPAYEPQVHRYVARDPARVHRQAVDVARVAASGLPVVLLVMHDREGGTLRHVHELAAYWAGRAVFFMLRPARGPSVQLDLMGASEALRLSFRMPGEQTALVEVLRGFGVGHVHFHHLLGHAPEVLELPARLGVAHDFTVHDFHAFCPQISLTGSDNTYCGEQGVDQCRACLRKSPAPGGLTIEQWRDTHGVVLAAARHVLVPSFDAARRVVRYAPSADVRHAPHEQLLPAVEQPAPAPPAWSADRSLKIAVIGALGPIKGADLLEDVAVLAAQSGAPLDFHLIGHAYRSLRTQPRAALTVHGKYDEADLDRLIDWLQPDLVWFPAQWPETYSYTLSACLARGLPVVAPDLGAFEERLSGRPWSWIRPWNAPAADWLAFFGELRTRHFAPGQGPSPTHRLQPANGELRVRPWSYERDYLAQIGPPIPGATLDPALLVTHGVDRAQGFDALSQGFKGRLLRAVLRLRSSSTFSGVTRAIPLRWQTRFKSWLQA